MIKITSGISSYLPGFTLITKSEFKEVSFHLRLLIDEQTAWFSLEAWNINNYYMVAYIITVLLVGASVISAYMEILMFQKHLRLIKERPERAWVMHRAPGTCK